MLVSGSFLVKSWPSTWDFVFERDLSGDCDPYSYIVYAVPKNGALSGPIVMDGEQDRFPGSIARCLKDMARLKGVPGIIFNDYDPKKEPCWPPKAANERPLTWQELDEALCNAWPRLRDVERGGAASSSSQIYGLDGELLKGAGAMRANLRLVS